MPAARYLATVERITAWGPTTRSLFLRLGDGARLPFVPGQFVSLMLPIGGAELVRPYSIASSPEDDLLELCVDLVPGGPGSAHLFALGVGAELALKGPFGSLLLDQPPAAEMVFVADGTGIAPIRPMVRRALAAGGDAPLRVLQGGRTRATLLYADELEAWAREHARLRWEPVLAGEATAAGENPPLEALVAERYVEADGDRTRHFWICAVGDLVRRLRELLRGAGYERRAVRYEQW
jgi:ferredoxin-NADP reductase